MRNYIMLVCRGGPKVGASKEDNADLFRRREGGPLICILEMQGFCYGDHTWWTVRQDVWPNQGGAVISHKVKSRVGDSELVAFVISLYD